MSKRLVTVGDVVLDLLLEVALPVQVDQHQMSDALRIEPGGACSTILAARNLGLEVAALGAIGRDLQGQMLRGALAGAGVDLSALESPAGSSTTTVIMLSDRQQSGHVFLGHYGGGGAISMTEAAHQQLQRADAVFLPGYTLADERHNELTAGVLAELARARKPLYVDAGPFMGQLDDERIANVLRLTDTLLLNEDEIPLVCGGAAGIDACRDLQKRYPDMLIALKRSRAGCHLLARDLDLPGPGYAVDVVDSIGAGDAFAGALIWARLAGYALPECAAIANAMGAASVTKTGAGRNVPTRADVQAILDENGAGIQLTC